MKKRDLKIQALLEVALSLALLILVNYLASRVFTRVDFTKEKRYTLSPASEKLAEELNDVLYVKVYLDGDDLPAAYRNLRNATKEMLDEFRHASGNRIEYEIFNPLEGLKGEDLKNVLLELRNSGIQALDLYEKTNDGSVQKLIVPGAHFVYKGHQYPMHIVDPSLTVNNASTVNKAVEALEFNIANTVRRCVQPRAKRIAFMEGHGELDEFQTADVTRLLGEFYTVERMNLNFDDSAFYVQFLKALQEVPEDSLAYAIDRMTKARLRSYDCIVFAKPRIAFADREKYWIDQYMMHGGKIMWMIDPLLIESDSIGKYGKMYSVDYDLNLTDLLFKYGVRVNPDVVMDYNGLIVPFAKESGQMDPKPWYYFPVLASMNNHAVNKNLDLVWLQYPASIDTVGSLSLKKTILLQTSGASKVSSHPAEVDMQIARKEPPPAFFSRKNVPVSVLVEGIFESPYKMVNRDDLDPEKSFREKVENGKMIVVGDGDLVANLVRRDGQFYAAGYDRFSQKIFGNRQFFMNCIDYLADDFGLVEVRNKEIQLRLLDKEKYKLPKDAARWKALNMLIPVALILLFGIVNGFVRKRKYER
jgi:ABC-2 type transport system permease protein